MATSRFASEFIKLDLPTFGAPTIETGIPFFITFPVENELIRLFTALEIFKRRMLGLISYYDSKKGNYPDVIQKDIYITAPIIKSTFFLCIILAVIFNLRQFEYVYLMTAGGPANKTQVLVVYIWNELTVQRLGRGSAAGVIMIALGAMLLLLLRRILKSETYN